jgi:hypothetical protein
MHQQQQQQMMAMPDDMIGAIKIKDGLFIGDEFAAQVRTTLKQLQMPKAQ